MAVAQRPLHLEMEPRLVELALAITAKRDGISVRRRFQCVFELAERVALVVRGEDTCFGEDGVRVQRAKEGGRVDEIVEHVEMVVRPGVDCVVG